MSKVILQGFILVPDADLEVVKHELVNHKKLTIAEPGCLTFEVIPDLKNVNKFNVYEEFVDQAAFDNHQVRIKSSDWAKVTKQVERQYHISSRAKNT